MQISGAFERYLGHQDYGLNWKSLTQPAILPLSTDYMPSVQALAKGYDVQRSKVDSVPMLRPLMPV